MAVPSTRPGSSTLNGIGVSALWFSLYAQWIAIVTVLVPRQVSDIAGQSLQEFDTGRVLGIGAWVALIVAPLAGALSDRARGARGRRRPYLIVGVVAGCLCLALLVPFGAGANLWLYAGVFAVWQFFGNWAAGPYAGLIPDVIPESGRAIASGWMVVMTVLGSGVGVVVSGQLIAPDHYAAAYAFLIVVMLAGLAVTLAVVREPAAAGVLRPFELGPFLRTFVPEPGTNRNFYWVLVTRFLATMGVWSVSEFFLFYLSDVLGMSGPEATKIGSYLIGAGSLAALGAGMGGARLSDRFGRVPIVRAGGWIMAFGATAFVAICAAPNVPAFAAVAILYYLGYGAYQSVDWALALDVLPDLNDAGKDMGIWHVSMVLPQIIAPPTTGWLIYVLKSNVSTSFAYAVAFGSAAIWFALAAALVTRVRLAPKRASESSRASL